MVSSKECLLIYRLPEECVPAHIYPHIALVPVTIPFIATAPTSLPSHPVTLAASVDPSLGLLEVKLNTSAQLHPLHHVALLSLIDFAVNPSFSNLHFYCTA